MSLLRQPIHMYFKLSLGVETGLFGTLDSLTETLDPLLIVPVEDLLDQFPADAPEELEEFKDEDGLIEVSLAVDAPLKHGATGSGGYNIKTPCRATDLLPF